MPNHCTSDRSKHSRAAKKLSNYRELLSFVEFVRGVTKIDGENRPARGDITERPNRTVRLAVFTRIISFRALKYKVGALPWQNCRRVKSTWHHSWGIAIGTRACYAYSERCKVHTVAPYHPLFVPSPLPLLFTSREIFLSARAPRASPLPVLAFLLRQQLLFIRVSH